MAGKKKSGEIDTNETVSKAPKKVKSVATTNEQVMQQLAQMQEALNKANELNTQFAEQLEVANKKAKDAGEKKDNTKPIPMNQRAFAKYVAKIKKEKPRVFNKKFDELVAKGKKFGITVTPIEEVDYEEESFSTTV